MTILVAAMYALMRAFKIERVVKKRPQVVVTEVVEVTAPQEVPLWLPWSYGWLGGYTGAVKRDMPHFYPGARPNPHRDERGAPEAHQGRIFHNL